MSIRPRSEIAALLVCALFVVAPYARADGDSLAQWRERFKAGMERYSAGALGDAIAVWEPVYREMGAKAGYRLAYNLGIAYQEQGDATRAAERFEAFLAEVDARRAVGETPEPVVRHEEEEGRRRLAELIATKGRFKVAAGAEPTAVQIDTGEPRLAGFVAYVAPGMHTVTFGVGSAGARSEQHDVKAGELVELAPPAPVPPRPTAPPPNADVAPPPHPAGPPSRVVHTVDRPFSPIVIYVGGALAVATIVLPALTYQHSADLRSQYTSAHAAGDQAQAGAITSEYGDARTVGYLSLAVPITLGVATAALTTWFFFGKQERDILVPIIAPTTNGAIVGAGGRF
jgi:hypothetical protein